MYEILQALRATNSKNEKEAIIRQHGNNPLFKKVLELTYSPLIKFGIKALPAPSEQTEEMINLDQAIIELNALINRELTGHAAIHHVARLLGHLSPEDAEIVRLMLGKSLKIGCEVTTINKALGKNFIKDAPYQGAVSYNAKKVQALFAKYDTIYSQVKMDGRYANVSIANDSVTLESRQGLPTYFKSAFDFLSGLDAQYGEPIVLNGELLIREVDRYTSNGIIASLVSIGNKIQEGETIDKDLTNFLKENGVSYETMLTRLMIVVWDFIPMTIYANANKWEKPYRERFAMLSSMVESLHHPQIALVESVEVRSASEAMEHFLACRQRGEEGTILKGNAPWQDGKPPYQVKFKQEIELDLLVESGNMGTVGTKNEHVISSINVTTQDGLLKTSPGGMSEALMTWVTENIDRLIGTVVAVKCNGISQDREGNYACLHPAVVRFRDDKVIANSLAECLEIHAGSSALS